MMAWKSTADSVSSFSSKIETRFLGDGATLNLNFFAASFWTGDGATEKRSVFFGDDGASSSWTTGVTCVEIKILRRVRAESSRRPPRHRRKACSMAWWYSFLTARSSQDGRAIAEK